MINDRCLKLGDTYPHTEESLSNLIALYKSGTSPKKPKSGE
jgi:hypothetical protein